MTNQTNNHTNHKRSTHLNEVFFQPAAQFKVARELLSEWSVTAPDRTLNILSLGCGPGFETTTLAMMLEEARFRTKNWHVDIYGLDLDSKAISKAQAALFNPGDLAWLTDWQREKWFIPRSGGFAFKTALAPPIHLATADLYAPELWPWVEIIGSFNLIFCRELTFNAPAQAPRRLVSLLSQVLATDGFIFTAPGEFLPLTDTNELHLEERAGVTWYRREITRIKTTPPPHTSLKKKKMTTPILLG